VSDIFVKITEASGMFFVYRLMQCLCSTIEVTRVPHELVLRNVL